ncbi:Membrane alanine aminopeptidase N [Coxiella-like endosymbiont]|nr:Membrane alanine aminopeptidase N [Coxiella-like endosymbiont]
MYVDLHEEKTNIKTLLRVRRNLNIQTSLPPLILNGEAMTLKRIALNGQSLSSSDYTINDSSLIIPDVPEEFILESEVIIQPHKNTRLSGLYKSRGNFCTQCEPHGFRRITYFLDRPDVLARYTTIITADKDKYPFIL